MKKKKTKRIYNPLQKLCDLKDERIGILEDIIKTQDETIQVMQRRIDILVKSVDDLIGQADEVNK